MLDQPPRMLDHNDADIDQLPGDEMAQLAAGCRAAAAERLRQAAAEELVPLRSRLEPPVPHTTPRGDAAVSIAYLVMAHRRFAHATVARAIRVLWEPAHLFLLHFDTRANASGVDWLRDRLGGASNVRFMSHRRAVGWGAFSMVEVLLEAMAAAHASAPAFDFFINLSDADLPLRTGAELGAFLSRFRGRSFVSVKFPAADEMRYHAHRHMRQWAWLECEGRGFLVINQSASTLFANEQRRCCYARSGPIVYAPLPLGRPAAPEGWEVFHGSQWVVLAREAVRHLLEEPQPIRWAQHVGLTYMSDETYVQTALMNSPLRASLVNHNLRYIDWPHGYGDPAAYWKAVGAKHFSGPMVLSPDLMPAVLGSGAAFARKADLELPEGVAFVEAWDKWMAAKMEPPHEAEAAPRHGHGQPEQPALAADLLAEAADLRLGTPPLPLEVEGLSPEEALARFPPRQLHYGHEDVMHQQFRPPPPPPRGAPGLLNTQKAEGAESEVAQRAAAEAAAQLAAVAAPAAASGPPRLSHIVFEDGSSCSCAASCAHTHECCDDHPEACDGTAWG